MPKVRFITKGKGNDARHIPIYNKKGISKSAFNKNSTKIKSSYKIPTLPNDPTRPKPIGNLSSFQRQLAEETLGSKIENVGFDENYFELENGDEYWIFDKAEDAEAKALEQEKDLLDSEPSIAVGIAERFPNEKFLYLTETDRHMLAVDMAERQTEGITDDIRADIVDDVEDQIRDEIESNPEKFGLTKTDVKEESNEWQDVFDKEVDELLERRIDEEKEERFEETVAEIEEKLENDPVDFLVEEEGLYSREDLQKQNFIRLDVDKIAEFVIETDGVEPTLATYDGNEEHVVKGNVELFMYRTN